MRNYNNNNNNRRRNYNNNNNNRRRNKKPYFPAFISYDEMEHGIEKGMLFQGPLRINGKNRQQAFVTIEGLDIDVYLDGEKSRNRSLNSDLVVLSFNKDKSTWKEVNTFNDSDKTSSKSNNNQNKINSESEQKALWCPRVSADASQAFAPYEKRNGLELTTLAKEKVAEINLYCKEKNVQPSAVVVYIKKRCHLPGHIGVLEPITKVDNGQPLASKDNFVRFKPMDVRFPFMMVPRSQINKEFQNNPHQFSTNLYKVNVEAEKWKAESRFPLGSYVCTVGEAGDIETETRVLLEEFGFARRGLNGDFSEDVHSCLRSYRLFKEGDEVKHKDEYYDTGSSKSEWKIPEEEFQKRRDLRKERIFTIDPSTAKDLDDALHVTDIGNGMYEIGVHIADVSYFVRPDNALDKEASIRATTVYLVQKSLPMLPRLLSENLCSLNPNADRLAYSCIWTMNDKGEMVDKEPWYGRTIIRTCCRLDYANAQDMIDDKIKPADAFVKDDGVNKVKWPVNRRPQDGHKPEDVINDVKIMHKIAMGRRRRRFASGSLALNQAKLCFKRDKDGRPIGVFTYPIKDSNRLVEEYMLLANYLVAEKLILGSGGLAPIRRHPAPLKKKLYEFTNKVMQRGYHLNAATAGDLQKSLNEVQKFNSDPMTVTALIKMATNPMKPAVYFAAGTLAKQETWRHYALNIPYYTHFTSPIRRYADVMVHRVLTAVLEDNVDELGLSVFDIEDVLEHCNEKKAKSKEAQDRCDQTFFCLYIQGRDIIAEACVVDWGDKSFELFIPEYGVSKRVHVDDLKCKMKTKEDSFVLSPKDDEDSGKKNTNNNNNNNNNNKKSANDNNNNSAPPSAPTTVATKTKPLVPDSKLKKSDRNEKNAEVDQLDDEMRKLTVSQANSNWGKSDNDIAALPKFKPGSDIPVFTLPNELTGIMEEVPAEILGRAVKFGVNVIYVRDLNGKKVEMMIPSMNTFVEAPNTTKKQNNNKFNKGSGKGKYSKKKSNNVKGSAKRNNSNYGDESKKGGGNQRNGKMGDGVLTEPTTIKMLKRMKVRLYMIKRVPVDFGVEILDIYDWDPIGYGGAK